VSKVDIVRVRKVGRMGDRQGGRERVKRGMSDDAWDGLKDSWREGLMEGGRACRKGWWWGIRLSAQRETEKTAYECACACVCVCLCV